MGPDRTPALRRSGGIGRGGDMPTVRTRSSRYRRSIPPQPQSRFERGARLGRAQGDRLSTSSPGTVSGSFGFHAHRSRLAARPRLRVYFCLSRFRAMRLRRARLSAAWAWRRRQWSSSKATSRRRYGTSRHRCGWFSMLTHNTQPTVTPRRQAPSRASAKHGREHPVETRSPWDLSRLTWRGGGERLYSVKGKPTIGSILRVVFDIGLNTLDPNTLGRSGSSVWSEVCSQR